MKKSFIIQFTILVLLIIYGNLGVRSEEVLVEDELGDAGGVRVEEIYGTEGQIRIGGDAPVSVWRKHTGEWEALNIEEEGHDEVGFPSLARAFVNAISGKEEVPVSAGDARHVLSIIRSAYESGRTGQPVDVL